MLWSSRPEVTRKWLSPLPLHFGQCKVRLDVFLTCEGCASSVRAFPFLLLKGRQQARHVGPGNGNSVSAVSLLLWRAWAPFARRFEERLECLSHGFPGIQIQADAALWLGHREQTGRDARRLRSLTCMVQGDHRQDHPFERFLDICWLVKVPAEALQRLNRTGVLPLCESDTHQQQHLPFVQGVPGLRGERGLCCPVACLSQVALSQPHLDAGIYHPANIVSKFLLLKECLCLVQCLLCSAQIPSCEREPRHRSLPHDQQLHLLPVLRETQ